MVVSDNCGTTAGVGSRKVYDSVHSAIADIGSGARIAVGGFGLCGIPDRLIEALRDSGVRDIEVFSNNCGVDGYGLGILLESGQLRRITASYVGENTEFARQYLCGEVEVELTPQGTLAERLRAGGAGIPALYTPAGAGTPVGDGGIPWRYRADGSVSVVSPAKESREFAGKTYILEHAITADFALVHAQIGDTEGNLVFDKTARNFNPLAAMAGKTTIAQVEELVQPGQLDPADVHLPGVFVQRIVRTGKQGTQIEKRVTRDVP